MCQLSLFFLFVFVCTVFPTPFPLPHHVLNLRSSEIAIKTTIQIDICHTLMIVVIILFSIVHLTSYLDAPLVHVKFIKFNTCINMLSKTHHRNLTGSHLPLFITILAFVTLFHFNSLLLLPSEFFLPNKVDTKRVLSPIIMSARLIQIFICMISFFILECHITLLHIMLMYLYSYPYELMALWHIFLQLALSQDVHPNPGPLDSTNGGFLSFCNWNLNTLSKNDFYRISLLEAHNANHNYDIISLCETSLNELVQVPENALPGYKFHACNHPNGDRNGGVGIFYKETLPLRIRNDLSFDECIVSEIIFGHRKIFFSVLYRNPHIKAQSEEFSTFLENLENSYQNIKNERPYASFYTGDFNAHSQSWYPEGDTNAEGVLLDNVFQFRSGPNHFRSDPFYARRL